MVFSGIFRKKVLAKIKREWEIKFFAVRIFGSVCLFLFNGFDFSSSLNGFI